jgi:DNA-binding XRE family transcriptional regulator
MLGRGCGAGGVSTHGPNGGCRDTVSGVPRQTHRPDRALGRAIRARREEIGRTQEDVAFNAKVTVNTLVRIELAQTSPEWITVRQIARALGITMGELGDSVEAFDKE